MAAVQGVQKPVMQLQVVLPAVELVKGGQGWHVEAVEAPATAEYFPVPQSMQSASPAGAALSVTCEVRGGTLSRDACARKQPYMSDG